MRQFGVFLPDSVNSGIGKMLKFDDGKASIGIVFPTKFVHQKITNLTMAGKFQFRSYEHRISGINLYDAHLFSFKNEKNDVFKQNPQKSQTN